MTDLLILVVQLLYTNPNNLIEPVQQEPNTCTIHSVYECNVVATGEKLDYSQLADEYGNKIREQGAYMDKVMKWLNKKGVAKLKRERVKKRFLENIRNGGMGIVSIENYQLRDKYFIDRGQGGSHAVCIVGMVEREGKEYLLARNSWGSESGILGYHLVNPSVVIEMFYYNIR